MLGSRSIKQFFAISFSKRVGVIDRQQVYPSESSVTLGLVGEQFAGIEEVLFSIWGLQDQFALWVEPHCYAG